MIAYENFIAAEHPINHAARELTKAAELEGRRPHHLAQEKIDECRLDDETCSRFWRSVWIQLVSDEYGVNRH